MLRAVPIIHCQLNPLTWVGVDREIHIPECVSAGSIRVEVSTDLGRKVISSPCPVLHRLIKSPEPEVVVNRTRDPVT